MRISFMALLLATPALADEIALPIPDPIYALPAVPSIRHIVHEPSGWHDLTYHHRPVIAAWRGRLYLAWHAAARSERTPPVVGLVSYSQDGQAWSKPAHFAKEGHAAYLSYTRARHRLPAGAKLTANVMPRTFHATPSRLYLLASAWADHGGKRYWRGRAFYTDDGVQWHEISPEQLDRQPNLLIRNHWGNGRLMRLTDGRLAAACNGRDGLSAPMTTDATASARAHAGQGPERRSRGGTGTRRRRPIDITRSHEDGDDDSGHGRMSRTRATSAGRTVGRPGRSSPSARADRR